MRVDGEWSFAQTLRHLMATDAWLRVSLQAVPLDEAFHPWGLPHAEFAQDGFDNSGFTDPPSYDAVLAVRGERVAEEWEHLRYALRDLDAVEGSLRLS